MVTQLECPHAKHHPQTGTHTQTAPRLRHTYTSVLFWGFWGFFVFALTGSRHCVCLMLVLKSDGEKNNVFEQPPQKAL